MKMREFTSIINIDLKEIPQPTVIKTLYDLESALAIHELKKILATTEHSESSTSKKSLEPYVTLLHQRWDSILNSDAIELYSPHTPANRICRKLAKMLGSALTQSSAKFLMHTLEVTTATDGTDLLELKPHQYVLSDSNTKPIEIYHCLYNSRTLNMAKNRKDPKPLCHTSKGIAKELSASEQLRVKNHSAATKDFIEKVATAKREELEKFRKSLETTLASDEYVVLPGYGMAGDERLRAKLYEGIDTRDKLFTKLLSLPKEFWEAYCHHMGVHRFLSIMSNGKIKAADIISGKAKVEDIPDEKYFSGEKEADRCHLYCLYSLYGELRAHDIYYHGYLSSISIWPFAYTQTSKVGGVEIMLAEILATDDITKLMPKLTDSSSDLYSHRGALKQGSLGKITMFTEQHLSSKPTGQAEEKNPAPKAATILGVGK